MPFCIYISAQIISLIQRLLGGLLGELFLNHRHSVVALYERHWIVSNIQLLTCLDGVWGLTDRWMDRPCSVWECKQLSQSLILSTAPDLFIQACTWQEQQSFMDVASETAADLTLELNFRRVKQAYVWGGKSTESLPRPTLKRKQGFKNISWGLQWVHQVSSAEYNDVCAERFAELGHRDLRVWLWLSAGPGHVQTQLQSSWEGNGIGWAGQGWGHQEEDGQLLWQFCHPLCLAGSDLAEELLNTAAELGSQQRTANPFPAQKYFIPPEQLPAWIWPDTAHLQNKPS